MTLIRGLQARAFGGAAAIMSGGALQSVSSIGILAVLSRLIPPDDFGLVAAAMVVVSFSQLFSQFGVGQALIQRTEITATHRKVAFTVSVALGGVVGLVVVLTAPLVAAFFSLPSLVPILRVLALVFPIQALSMVGECLLQRDLEFRRLATVNALAHVIGYGGAGIIAALAGLGIWALVIAELARVILRMTLALISERSSIGFSVSRRELSDILGFGGGYSFVRFANFFGAYADNLVIGRQGTAGQLGLYSKAYQLAMVPALLLGTVADRVLFPLLSSIQTDLARVVRGFRASLGMAGLLSAPLTALAVTLSNEIIRIVLGPGWEASAPAFRSLSFLLMIRASYKICDSLVRSRGAVYQHAVHHAFLALTVLLGSAVGFQWGITGTAIGVTIALALAFLWMLSLCSQLLSVTFSSLCVIFAPHIAWTAVFMAAGSVTRHFLLPHGPLITAAGVTLVVGSLFVAILTRSPMLLGEGATLASSTIRSLLQNVSAVRTRSS